MKKVVDIKFTLEADDIENNTVTCHVTWTEEDSKVAEGKTTGSEEEFPRIDTRAYR